MNHKWTCWKKTSFCLEEGQEEDLGNYSLVCLTLIPWKVMEQTVLRTGKWLRVVSVDLSLTKLIAAYSEMTTSVAGRRAVDVLYCEHSKALDTVSHTIFIDKRIKYRLGRSTVRWVENQVNWWAQRLVISVHPESSYYWCIPGINTEANIV